MHNVKKTPASDAQLAARVKERDLKLQIYVELRNLIFDKRGKNELDEQILELTSEILKKNPDIYTFWNIRRDTLGILAEKREDENDEEHMQRLKTLYDKELKLTFKGIESNPKSYSSWYQRAWTLQKHPEPDLKAELALCEHSLSYVDCRNFHCWDHRRVVSRMAGLDAQEELDFSDRLIKLNPSNYSAWHYRGTLLQRMHREQKDDGDTARLIGDDVVSKELETVKNVCAYNSEDQTAWTYCRWLCEALCAKVGKEPILVCVRHDSFNAVCLTFSCAVSEEKARLFIDGDGFELKKASKFGTPQHKHVMVHEWILISDGLNDLRLKFNDSYLPVSDERKLPLLNKDYLQKFHSLDSKCETEKARLALSGVVEMCEGLIQEEEDIPWEVLMLARMLPLLNGQTPETLNRVQELLARTIQLDPQRRNVYAEMSKRASKILSLPNSNDDALYEYFRLNKNLNQLG